MGTFCFRWCVCVATKVPTLATESFFFRNYTDARRQLFNTVYGASRGKQRSHSNPQLHHHDGRFKTSSRSCSPDGRTSRNLGLFTDEISRMSSEVDQKMNVSLIDSEIREVADADAEIVSDVARMDRDIESHHARYEATLTFTPES